MEPTHCSFCYHIYNQMTATFQGTVLSSFVPFPTTGMGRSYAFASSLNAQRLPREVPTWQPWLWDGYPPLTSRSLSPLIVLCNWFLFVGLYSGTHSQMTCGFSYCRACAHVTISALLAVKLGARVPVQNGEAHPTLYFPEATNVLDTFCSFRHRLLCTAMNHNVLWRCPGVVFVYNSAPTYLDLAAGGVFVAQNALQSKKKVVKRL